MSGHGHVTPNPDGSKARCGGPGICTECSKEFSQRHRNRPTPIAEALDTSTPQYIKWDGEAHTANKYLGERYGVDWEYQKDSRDIWVPVDEDSKGRTIVQPVRVGDLIVISPNRRHEIYRPA